MGRRARYLPLLHIAVIFRKGKICKILIKEGADVKGKDSEGSTPLMTATVFGFVDIVKILIKNGADLNAKNRNKETALHIAASWGKLEICKELLKAGADINSKEEWERTPLIYAAMNGNFDICKFLIEKGAKINECRRHMKLTVLGEAKDIIKQHGCDIKKRNEKKYNEYLKIIKYFEKIGMKEKCIE